MVRLWGVAAVVGGVFLAMFLYAIYVFAVTRDRAIARVIGHNRAVRDVTRFCGIDIRSVGGAGPGTSNVICIKVGLMVPAGEGRPARGCDRGGRAILEEVASGRPRGRGHVTRGGRRRACGDGGTVSGGSFCCKSNDDCSFLCRSSTGLCNLRVRNNAGLFYLATSVVDGLGFEKGRASLAVT